VAGASGSFLSVQVVESKCKGLRGHEDDSLSLSDKSELTSLDEKRAVDCEKGTAPGGTMFYERLSRPALS